MTFQVPMFFNDKGWTLPEEFPDLSGEKELAIDIETCDPGLTRGDGPATFSDGYIAGIAVGTQDRGWYFPVNHRSGINMDEDKVFAWMRELAAQRDDRTWVGANILYDLEYLSYQAGCQFRGRFHDVQFAAAVLDEQRFTYRLRALAKDYLGEDKDDAELYQWIASAHHIKKISDESCAKFIHTAPPALVAPRAISDVTLPLRLRRVLVPALGAAGLGRVAALEMRLLPLLLAMRLRGVPVNVQKAESARSDLQRRIGLTLKEIKRRTGVSVDVWAAESVAKALEAEGVYDYPRTPKTQAPSFRKDWLERHPSDIARLIAEVRKYDKLINTFINGYILGKNVNGIVHASFHPLSTDEGGTVSGRFSSSDPNLQNIPARDEFSGPLIRGIFVPFDGHEWRKYDYSQIEYRLLAHFAVGRGSETIRKRYREDPTTDYHTATQEQIAAITGIHLDRKPVKNINFGLAYGMQLPKLARGLGLTEDEARPLWEAYHKGVPFVQTTFDKYQRIARVEGEVRTLLGRRRQFKLFTQRSVKTPEALEYDAAVRRWGDDIRRCDTHVGLNHLLQGTSADIIKEAMAQIWETGLWREVGVPLAQVHDELDFSAPSDAPWGELQSIMENALKEELSVPILCEGSAGESWGQCG